MSNTTIRFSTPMIHRKVPEPPAPIVPPYVCSTVTCDLTPPAASARARTRSRPRPRRKGGGKGDNDRRMTEREEEADSERSFPLLEQLPCCVVDRCDVVGIEGVAKTECVAETPDPGQRRIAAGVQQEESPACDVQCRDCASESREAQPLLLRQ